MSELLTALLRRDPVAFLEKVGHQLTPEFMPAWYLDAVLYRCLRGIGRNGEVISINMPPGSGETLLCAVALPLWVIATNPNARAIVYTGSSRASTQIRSMCQQVLEAEWYRRAFPQSATPGLGARGSFGRYQVASIWEAPVDGVADLIVIVEPVHPGAPGSPAMSRIPDWYDHTVPRKLRHASQSSIIYASPRLGPQDLTAHLGRRHTLTRLVFPAIATQREEWRLHGGWRHIRRIGDCLMAEGQQAKADLEIIKAVIGREAFETIYQQLVAPLGALSIMPDIDLSLLGS